MNKVKTKILLNFKSMSKSKTPFKAMYIWRKKTFMKIACYFVILFSILSCQTDASTETGISVNGKTQISGRYPHLAMFNHQGECGIGAVVPWADRLWAVTYSPHEPYGSNDGLYEITADLQITKRPESIGGTPANRMIHPESNQLFIGPYAIDQDRNVRSISYDKMPGRPTATVRHLTHPAEKVYYFTMEEGMYEVDVKTLQVDILYEDANVTPGGIGGELLPGYHGKGAYSGQGRVVYANNGRIGGGNLTDFTLPSGCLASWDGSDWQVLERRQFADVTGPGGISGNTTEDAPLWSIGWDYRSVILKLLDHGEWLTFRLPKGDYSYEGLHGWHTEWPRIRQVGPDGQYLMNMHGMWFEFPGNFSKENHSAPSPIANYLKITGDFARFQDQLVFGCDDAAKNRFDQGENLVGQSQSNLWFTHWDSLKNLGNPYGYGGPWVHDTVEAKQPSDPFGIANFSNRQLHLSHENGGIVNFNLEIDRTGEGNWEQLTSVSVPGGGYVRHTIADDLDAEWIRITPDQEVKNVTAYFHFGSGGGAEFKPELFSGLADAGVKSSRSVGLIRPRGEDRGTLHFAAWTIDENGEVTETGYYEIGEDMNLQAVENQEAHEQLKAKAKIEEPEFQVDEASVIMVDNNGKRYRLPKGNSALDEPSNFGWPRDRREVVTERDLFNAHGTFYYLPRANSGGVAKIKPITTHNKHITDFCSWRGMLVMTGTGLEENEDKHYIKSEDGKAGLWFGDIDDLWKMGKPKGQGGPWKNTHVEANVPSESYLMTGYDKKSLELSHDAQSGVTFTIEIDVLGDGSWHTFKQVEVTEGGSQTFEFPEGFSAHWVRLQSDKSCRASAIFTYQ